MRYNGNNKETKEAILKENQPYIYEKLKGYTKLDLLNIIDNRSQALDRERMTDDFNGQAIINVYVNNELKQEIFFEPDCTEINIKDVFAVADKYENIYIDYHDVKTEIIFTRDYPSM